MNPWVDGDSAFAEMGGATTPNLSTVNYHSKLVGVTFEGRQDIIKMLKGDEPLRTRREPENEYDKNAVAVDVQIAETWHPIGYIAKDKNQDICNAMDAGNEIYIAIASITGQDKKSLGVNIALAYEKVSRTQPETPQVAPEPTNSSTIFDSLAHELSVISSQGFSVQITPILNTETYSSRILGRSTQVHRSPQGYISMPGYLSGSSFPEKFYRPFDREGVIAGIVEKFGVKKEHVEGMWGLNNEASTGFGTAIHAALENYDTYYKLGDKIKKVKAFKTKPDEVGPNKALSKNPFLKKIVEDFHERFGGDYVRVSEQFVWLHEEKMAGTIDRIKVIDADKRIVRIQDFKTDGDIHEKKYQTSESPFKKEMGSELLDYHWLQLSFYAYILKHYGYTVEGLDIYWLNPETLSKGENPWEEFSSKVIDITKGL